MSIRHQIAAAFKDKTLVGDSIEDLLLTFSLIKEEKEFDEEWKLNMQYALYTIASILKGVYCKDKTPLKTPRQMQEEYDSYSEKMAQKLNDLKRRMNENN